VICEDKKKKKKKKKKIKNVKRASTSVNQCVISTRSTAVTLKSVEIICSISKVGGGGEESERERHTRVYPKVSGLSHNEININNSKHSLRSNIKGYGGKTH
jgi:hypothetical protein